MAGYTSRLGVPSFFANPPYKAASLRAQGQLNAVACDKTTRRANQQKAVQPSREKYSA
jgi:hypothetical protein